MDIFLTHLHSDHAGLAPELIRPGCQNYISDVDGPGLEEGLSDRYWKDLYRAYVRDGFSEDEVDWLWGKNPAQGSAPERRPMDYTHLRNGAVLQYGGHTLRCLLTPGHVCLYEQEAGWLFTGDHIPFHITPNICRWSRRPDSLGDYLESLDSVRDLPAQMLLPAHRGVEGGLADRVDALKRHHMARLSSVADIVEKEPGLTAYEIAGRMRWSIRCRNWAEFPTTQKFFAVGETLAHLDYLETRRQLRRREGGKNRYYPLHTAGDAINI